MNTHMTNPIQFLNKLEWKLSFVLTTLTFATGTRETTTTKNNRNKKKQSIQITPRFFALMRMRGSSSVLRII